MKYDNLLLRDYFLKYKYKIIIPSCLINSNLLSKIKELNLESVVKNIRLLNSSLFFKELNIFSGLHFFFFFENQINFFKFILNFKELIESSIYFFENFILDVNIDDLINKISIYNNKIMQFFNMSKKFYIFINILNKLMILNFNKTIKFYKIK